MIGYLICEDGPQAGLTITLDEGDSWEIGRDPTSGIRLDDPMVSRKHALIRKEDNRFIIKNLSEVNPLHVNGEAREEAILEEEDTIQIGNNVFRFTHSEQAKPKNDEPSHLFLKVIAGPNQGAEFALHPGKSYILGKESSADLIFQDLSVSNRHAKLTISATGDATIEDLNSRNGLIVNGLKLNFPSPLPSQGMVSMGTTVFLFLNEQASEQTLFTQVEPPSPHAEEAPSNVMAASPKNWKETFIPTKHLALAAIFATALFAGFISLISLFHEEPLVKSHVDATKDLHVAFEAFPSVQYTYNASSGKLLLTGHVLTEIDHTELTYMLKNLTFIKSIENAVVIDEGVWQEMNALLSRNPVWRSVLMTATAPGKFVLRGYLPTESDMIALQDYVQLNFFYLNLLDNQVIVEHTLQTQIGNLLIEKGFSNTEFQLGNGEVLVSGRVNEKERRAFLKTLEEMQHLPGVRNIKNLVIYTSEQTTRIDLTAKYPVMGSSKLGNLHQYVLIGGKILAVGDTLDGMTITEIGSTEVLLDKDGAKYKIDYNQP